MSEVENLMDLCDKIGFARVDEEVEVWIESGAYDYQILERAKQMDFGHRFEVSSAIDQWQALHRFLHPNGPYGYEFCASCTSLLKGH